MNFASIGLRNVFKRPSDLLNNVTDSLYSDYDALDCISDLLEELQSKW